MSIISVEGDVKEFRVPEITIQKFEPEDVMRTSGCMVEALACVKCYEQVADCEPSFNCAQLVCPILNDIY